MTPFCWLSGNRLGSRFRRAGRHEGMFCVSGDLGTVPAETAYYLIRFFAASACDPLPRQGAQLTRFTICNATRIHIDLALSPLNHDADCWTRPTRYRDTRILADSARRTDRPTDRRTDGPTD